MEPWLAKLNAGEPQAAWDLFHERYRKLILATIRRLLTDHDDVMDLFSTVCEALTADDFARMRRYSQRAGDRANAGTWVVIVVRNLTVDFLRKRDGRQRHSVPPGLSPLQQEIYRVVCIDGQSHVEAFERIRARMELTLSFTAFLREVRTTHLAAPCPDRAPVRRPVRDTQEHAPATVAIDPAESADATRKLSTVLASHPADVRLAVELFVVDGMPAADVARLVGWPDAKTVYNRVYRALKQIRASFQAEGIGPGDLR